MSAGAFKNIFLSLNFTTKHTLQRLFALAIHGVMCCIAGVWGKAVRVGLCVPPCGRLLLRSNIAHNTSVWTHQIPEYMERLKKASPLWFVVIEGELNTLKLIHGDDFKKLTKIIRDEMNIEFDIPQL